MNKLINTKDFALQDGWQVLSFELKANHQYIVTGVSGVSISASSDGSTNAYSITVDTPFVPAITTSYIRAWTPSAQTLTIEELGLIIEQLEAAMENADNVAVNVYNDRTLHLTKTGWNRVSYIIKNSRTYAITADSSNVVIKVVDANGNVLQDFGSFTTDVEKTVTATTDGVYLDIYVNPSATIKIIDNGAIIAELVEFERDAKSYLQKAFILYEDDFEKGSLLNGNNDGYRANARARSKNIMSFWDDVVITPNGSSLSIAYFDSDGTYSHTEGWLTAPTTILANQKVRLLLTEFPNSEETKSVSEILSMFSVQTAYKESLEEIKNSFVPSYYFKNDYLKGKIEDVVDKCGMSTNMLNFAFITDLHIDNNACHSMDIIKYMSDNCPAIPFVVCGGDIPIVTATELNTVLEQGNKWYSMMGTFGKDRVFQVRGNHDYLGVGKVEGERVEVKATKAQCKQYVTGNIDAFVEMPINCLYYYIDIPSKRTRLVCLDLYDNLRNVPLMDGDVGIDQEQFDWILETALDCENYNIVFITHESADPSAPYYVSALEPLQALFKALKNKTSLSYSGHYVDLSADFTNTTNELVYVQSGHMHRDWSHTDDNMLSVVTNCDSLYTDGGYDRTVRTVNEQSFDIVSIDLIGKKIYMTRIGAGLDREFTY